MTYQALHAAMKRIEDVEIVEETEFTEKEDYSNFDLVAELKEKKIKTICIDEAHHLKSEWQKALEAFIKAMGDDIFVVSLTATPPYDSTPAEWDRYISTCGEISEEIKNILKRNGLIEKNTVALTKTKRPISFFEN